MKELKKYYFPKFVQSTSDNNILLKFFVLIIYFLLHYLSKGPPSRQIVSFKFLSKILPTPNTIYLLCSLVLQKNFLPIEMISYFFVWNKDTIKN